MSESRPPTFATEQTVAQAKAVYANLLDEVDGLRQRAAEFRERAAAVEGEAATAEKDVRVVVGPQGELRKLDIDPRAYRRLGPTELAEEILALSRTARRAAAEQIEHATREILGRDFDVEAHLEGRPQPPRESRLPTAGQSMAEWLDRLKEGRL
jgi:DNA-binding protein YbaB